MAKVANLMANHNGTPTAVASLYDEKISVVKDEHTVVLVHFTEDGLVDECGNNWNYCVGTDTLTTQDIITQDCTFYSANSVVSAAFANEGYKEAVLSSTQCIVMDSPVELGGNTPFRIEMWFGCDTIATLSSATTINRKIWQMDTEDGTENFQIIGSLYRNGTNTSVWHSKMTSSNCFVNDASYTHPASAGVTRFGLGTNLVYYIYDYFFDESNSQWKVRQYFNLSLSNISYRWAGFLFGSGVTTSTDVRNFIPKFGNGALTTRLAELKITKNPPALISVYETDTAVSATSLPKNPNTLLYSSAGLPVKGNLCVQALTPYAQNTKILMHFDDPDNPFKDECNFYPMYKVAGTTSLTETNAQFGTALNFDGSTYFRTNGKVSFGGQDFTIDCWAAPQIYNYAGDAPIWQLSNSNTQRIQLAIQSKNGKGISLFRKWNGNDGSSGFFNFQADNLIHYFAVSYVHSTGTWYCFVDGILQRTHTWKISRISTYLYFGFNCGTNVKLVGQLCEFRFIDGQALWTEDFTPPDKPYALVKTLYAPLIMQNSPAVDDKTVALLHFDDPNNPCKDECGNTWIIHGSPVIVNHPTLGNSIYFNYSDKLTFSSLSLGNQDFTVDFKFNFTSYSNIWQRIFYLETVGTGERYFVLGISDTHKIYFSTAHGTDYFIDSVLKLGVDNHFAVVFQKANSRLLLFANGTLAKTISFSKVRNCYMGLNNVSHGYIKEFRFVDGLQVWTSNFTPPTEPYSLNTVNTKQPPCIGVRNQGNNFYTVR